MNIIPFLLSVLTYIIITSFMFFLFFNRQKDNIEKPKEVYFHSVIIKENEKKYKQHKIEKHINKHNNDMKKKVDKKGSDSTVEKYSNSDFKSLFQNVNSNYNNVKKVEQKKQTMSRLESNNNNIQKEILKELKKVSRVDIKESTIQINHSKLSKKDLDYLDKQISYVWNSLHTSLKEKAVVNFIIKNGRIDVKVLFSNLRKDILNQLIIKLKHIDVKNIKNIDIILRFKSKEKK